MDENDDSPGLSPLSPLINKERKRLSFTLPPSVHVPVSPRHRVRKGSVFELMSSTSLMSPSRMSPLMSQAAENQSKLKTYKSNVDRVRSPSEELSLCEENTESNRSTLRKESLSSGKEKEEEDAPFTVEKFSEFLCGLFLFQEFR